MHARISNRIHGRSHGVANAVGQQQVHSCFVAWPRVFKFADAAICVPPQANSAAHRLLFTLPPLQAPWA